MACSDPVPLLMRPRDIAKHFGISLATIYRWLKAGLLENVKVGKSNYIMVASVHAHIDRLRCEQTKPKETSRDRN